MKPRNLVVFFTRGISLSKLYSSKLIYREFLIYQRLLDDRVFDSITFITYGKYCAHLYDTLLEEGLIHPSFEFKYYPSWFPRFSFISSFLYSILAPFLHHASLRKSSFIKTNQISGAIPALLSSFIYQKPLFVRSGYLLSRITSKQYKHNPLRILFSYTLEYISLLSASISSVSNPYDQSYIKRNYILPSRKIPILLPNYVDTSLFHPTASVYNRRHRVITVSRLSPEKNLLNLIQACHNLDIGLDIIGDGEQKYLIQNLITDQRLDVTILPPVPNTQLPSILNEYKYFALVSLWEGLPKSLIEALACGNICIGTKTTGITELITDSLTGFLSFGFDSSSISMAFNNSFSSDLDSISKNASNFIHSNYSLDHISKLESSFYKQ